MAENNKVVIIGANGTMGAGAGCVFAGAGYTVTLLARSSDKAAAALLDVQNDARADAIAERITLGTYDDDLARTIGEAGLIFESLAEDLPLKKQFFALVDKYRRPDAIVATGSSGLSIAAMAAGRSESFRRNFLGIHLFNPPHVIVGTEVIPGPDTNPAVLKTAIAMLTYSWIGVNVQEPLWKDRIMSAVDSQLTAKGWQKVASGGDAAVSAVGATNNQQTVNTFYDGMGGFGGGWGHRGWWGGGMGGMGMSTSEVENTPVGTLHIDIFDGKTKNVIWHAVISNTLSSKPEKNEDKMRKAVEDAFKKFPKEKG